MLDGCKVHPYAIIPTMHPLLSQSDGIGMAIAIEEEGGGLLHTHVLSFIQHKNTEIICVYVVTTYNVIDTQINIKNFSFM